MQIVTKNIFLINLDPTSSDRYLLVHFLNQTLIDLIPFQVFFSSILKNTNQLICHLAFHFKTFFQN